MAYAEVVVSSSQATSESLPISVLDLMPSRAGEPASSAIAQSVELARHVEQLGYKRYWVADSSPRSQPKINTALTTFECLTQPPKIC